jgi:choline dehydrogenase-like flavoprotein
MLSGMGPAEHLRSHGIDVKSDLPVGRNLQDHVVVENLYERKSPGEFHAQMRFDRIAVSMVRAFLFGTGFAATIPSPLLGFVRSESSSESPDFEFMFPFMPAGARPWFPILHPAYSDAFAVRSAILHPRSRGEVLLKSADPREAVRVRMNCLTHEDDIVRLRAAFRVGRDMASQASLTPFRGTELTPGTACQSDSEIDDYIRRT